MSEQSSQPVLPTRKRSRWPWIAAAAAVVVVAGVIVGVVANRDDSDDATATTGGGTKAETVRIGVADASAPYWKTYSDLAEQRLNVTVELVNFSDYSQPNPALKQKQLELNQFQHIQYLANYNVTA